MVKSKKELITMDTFGSVHGFAISNSDKPDEVSRFGESATKKIARHVRGRLKQRATAMN